VYVGIPLHQTSSLQRYKVGQLNYLLVEVVMVMVQEVMVQELMVQEVMD
jgi:hypothetical protein